MRHYTVHGVGGHVNIMSGELELQADEFKFQG